MRKDAELDSEVAVPGMKGPGGRAVRLDLVLLPALTLQLQRVAWSVGAETDGPHHFVEKSYSGHLKDTYDPVVQRGSNVDKMLAYLKSKDGRCSFIRQRAKPIFESCRRERGYDALEWYRHALDVVGEHARDGRAVMVYAREPDKDWYSEHVKLLEGSALICVPLDAHEFRHAR
jgi:hypothetical protein